MTQIKKLNRQYMVTVVRPFFKIGGYIGIYWRSLYTEGNLIFTIEDDMNPRVVANLPVNDKIEIINFVNFIVPKFYYYSSGINNKLGYKNVPSPCLNLRRDLEKQIGW